MARVKQEDVTEEVKELRTQMWKHELFVQWISDEFGIDLDTLSAAEIVAWRAAKNGVFRKSQVYIDAIEADQEERATVKAEKAAAVKAAPKAEKAAKATKATAKATKATKAAATPAKATRARKGTAAAEADPFS